MPMDRSNHFSVRACLGGLGLLATLSSAGCQSDYAGQTLPSAYWQQDDIQYFPPGPEFKLSREAAAIKTYGTGRGTKRSTGPLGPPQPAPAPGGDLDGVNATPVVPLPRIDGAAPPAPADMPAEGEAPPGGEEPADGDPFNIP